MEVQEEVRRRHLQRSAQWPAAAHLQAQPVGARSPVARSPVARRSASRRVASSSVVVGVVGGVCWFHLWGCIAIEVAALISCLICKGVQVELIELCTVYKQASKLTFTRVCEGKEA